MAHQYKNLKALNNRDLLSHVYLTHHQGAFRMLFDRLEGVIMAHVVADTVAKNKELHV